MNEFVICINNEGFAASLIVGKVYRTLSDEQASALDLIRVVDEDKSEPDGYLYPITMFAAIEVPAEVERVLLAA